VWIVRNTVVLAFSAATLASAVLMFSVEPMLAKMLLPILGGAPAVWNASLVFFQAVLLIGYGVAHGLAKLGPKVHAVLHAGVLTAALLSLPITVHPALASGAPPALRVLVLLTVAAGLPFFALAMGTPGLGRQFATIDHPTTRDPYFLYAASNAGSVLALLAYPFVVERFAPLSLQSILFSRGWIVLLVLVAMCAAMVLRLPSRKAIVAKPSAPIPWPRKLRWMVLAAVPSAYLLAVTQYLTTDIAAAPLLWVIPLLLYLTTFVLAFAARLRPNQSVVARLLPLPAACAAVSLAADMTNPALFIGLVHLAAFSFAAMMCHGALADDRPDAGRLTELYLWMSVGGVVGGLVVAMGAPFMDRTAEYPALIVAALLLRPSPEPDVKGDPRRDRIIDGVFAAVIGLLTIGLIQLATSVHGTQKMRAAFLGIPLLVAYRAIGRPSRFAFAMGAMLLATMFFRPYAPILHRARNFFGALTVVLDEAGHFVQLKHGTTVHGQQSMDPAQRRVPTKYYNPTGPVGDVLARHAETRNGGRIAVVGLGIGTMAAYARPDEKWTFFEINQNIVDIARDTRFFTYLADAFPNGSDVDVGDARLRLAIRDEKYDVLVIDAFTSDAIPVHLVTVEAFDLYAAHLEDTGILAIHCTNGYVELEPELAAQAVERNFAAYIRRDVDISEERAKMGTAESIWIAMARSAAVLGRMTSAPWRPVIARADIPAWTDDSSSIVPLLQGGGW
jgi:hypothetical protein